MNVITIDDEDDEGGGKDKNGETRPTADDNGFDYDADVSSVYYTVEVGDFKIFPFGSFDN
jgi:hypothetical protein